MKYNLDFNIYYAKDRCNSIRTQNLEGLSKKELEAIANYILYGKDEDDRSSFDRGEISKVETKFSSYKKTEPVSLDALLESPTFNENIFVKDGRYIYKKEKPILLKEKISEIPGMIELQEEISKLQQIYDENIEKIPLEEGKKKLTPRQLYFLKHQIIEMRNKQYILQDSAFPIIPHSQNKFQFYGNVSDSHLSYEVFPRGVMSGENDIDFMMPRKDRRPAIGIPEEKKKEFYIDFTNPDHVYELVLAYWDLKEQIRKIPDSPINNLLWTLDFYIEKADLSEQQMLIVEDKKFRYSNKDISKHLQEKLGIYHQENYVSTIWNRCCGLISAAAELNYDEYLCKDYDKAWKVCSCCGKELLRDPRNFVRKGKSLDGLTGKCKKCDKAARNLKKKKILEKEEN